MPLPDRLRLPFHFEPDLLQRDLETLCAMDWTPHFVTQNYDGDWSVIALRASAGARHPVTMIYSDPSATQFVDTPALERCPHFREVLERFACELRAVRLMRLTPGSLIKEHRDHDLDAEEGMARIHIPVTSNPHVVFEVNRRQVDMAPGSVWYLRLSDPHRAANNGPADRVHLVIDAVVNDWLQSVLERAAEEFAVTP